MINTIGFLQNNTELKELKEFTPDENIKKHLDYLQIPIIPKSDFKDDDVCSEDEERPILQSTDNILFCTPNTEEISNVAFYGYDDTTIFFHHDLLVFSTIIDSCSIENDSRYVAVATFEPDVMIYDFSINLPLLPQALLIGHTGPVTGIKNKYGKLVTSSEDKTIITWDSNKLQIKEQTKCDVVIERFDFENKSFVFGANTYLNINNENIPLDYAMEQLRIKEDMVYVTDSEGNISIFDVRKPAKALFTQKIHDGAVVDMCLAKDWTVTTSLDKKIKLWKLENNEFVCKSVLEQEHTVFALGYNDKDDFEEVFAGNEDDFVFPIRLCETVKTD